MKAGNLFIYDRMATRTPQVLAAIIASAIGMCGCSPSSDATSSSPPASSASSDSSAVAPPRVALHSTPELLKLFGGEGNLSEVQNAYSSSNLNGLPIPVTMYSNGRYGRMADMVGTADSYDFTKPVDGELKADLTAYFTGARYWEAMTAGRDEKPVIVMFDMQRRILEVRVRDQVQGRASFEPVAPRLEAFFKELGYVPDNP